MKQRQLKARQAELVMAIDPEGRRRKPQGWKRSTHPITDSGRGRVLEEPEPDTESRAADPR